MVAFVSETVVPSSISLRFLALRVLQDRLSHLITKIQKSILVSKLSLLSWEHKRLCGSVLRYHASFPVTPVLWGLATVWVSVLEDFSTHSFYSKTLPRSHRLSHNYQIRYTYQESQRICLLRSGVISTCALLLTGVLLLALEMVCSLRTDPFCCIPDLPFVRVMSDPMEWMPPRVDTSACFQKRFCVHIKTG